MTEQELEDAAVAYGKRGLLCRLFPIIKLERARFIYMCLIFCISAAAYSLLRLSKDIVIHTALESSAQSWLKVLTCPVSIFTISLINKTLSKSSIDIAFRTYSLGFGCFLCFLGCFLYTRSYVQLAPGITEVLFSASMLHARGLGILYIPCLIVNHWTLAAFYILSEVIGSIMVSFMPLTYFNSHVTADQNKRFVCVLYFFSNISSFLTSYSYKKWSEMFYRGYQYTGREFCYFAFPFIAGLSFLFVYFMSIQLNKHFARPIVSDAIVARKKSKVKLGILDGIFHAFTSKILLSICLMMLFYNFAQVVLTSQMAASISTTAILLEMPDKSAYSNETKGKEMFLSALAVAIIVMTPCPNMFEKFGLRSSGLIPIFASIGGGFASFYLGMRNYPAVGGSNMCWPATLVNDSKRLPELEMTVNVYASVFLKVSKYAFFDIIKEAISMKINPEIRPLWKGVFDGVCGKSGKFLASIYLIFMEALTLVRDARYYAVVHICLFSLFAIAWIWALNTIHYAYQEVVETGGYFRDEQKSHN